MAYFNGASSSEVPSCPVSSEDIHGCGQPGPSSSDVATATKTDKAASTASENADPLTEKVSNLSRSVSSLFSSFKKRGSTSRASQEGKGASPSTRRRKDSTGLVTGGADVVHWTRELVLSEAESDTEWYQEIERRDCKTLMRLLHGKEGRPLLQKTGKAGRTVLHVAAIQGSLELVDIIQRILSSGNVEAQSAKELTDAKDGRCAMNAANIAVHIVGNIAVGLAIGGVSGYPRSNPDPPSPPWVKEYELTQERVNDVQKIISCVVEQGRYEGLIKSFEENVDYNFCSFEIYGHLFLFHHACSRVDGEWFVKDVIEHCREVSEEQVMELMKLRDFQGRTPLHVSVVVAPAKGRDHVLGNLVGCLGCQKLGGMFLGVEDGRGWTPLHLAATQPYSKIFEELIHSQPWDGAILRARTCPYFWTQWENGIRPGLTALHLAVLHNNVTFVHHLLGMLSSEERSARLLRTIFLDHPRPESIQEWTALSLSLLLGNADLVEQLLHRRRSYSFMEYEESNWMGLPTICLVAALGNTEFLRQVMNDLRLDPFARDQMGRTTLHYAANGMFEPFNDDKKFFQLISIKPRRAYTYVCVTDIPNVAWLDELHASLPHEEPIERGYSGRKGCINMLLQAGVDIWQKDENGRIASPGRQTTDDDFISWWHEKIAKETLDTRNNLNQGGNAISVIGALIATASYVGPLQPPLNYGSDPSVQLSPTSDNSGYAHVWDLPVRVFMVSNSLAFYLAIASIMLAVVPSLPMPQEALLNELERTRKTVALAICVLILSIVGILVSYAAASIAIMPKHNVGLASYPALVGGFACMIGIVLFIIRVLRLMYPDKCRKFKKVWQSVCVCGSVCGKVFRECAHYPTRIRLESSLH